MTSGGGAARPDHAVQHAVTAARALSWSPKLLALLIEELYTDETIAELLGSPIHRLPKHRYAEAVAAALIIRHSWQAADLAWVSARLGLKRSPKVARVRATRGLKKRGVRRRRSLRQG